MTDTDTTEAPAPEASEPKPDYAQILTDAFVSASTNAAADGSLSDETIASVQEVFRSIPAGARGKAQGAALKAVITQGNALAVEALLDATQNLPRATSGTSRVSKPKVDPVIALAISAAGTLVAFADLTSDPELGEQAATMAKGWYNDGAPDEHKEAILRAAAGATKGAVRRTRSAGGGGGRRTYSDTLKDIIERGELKTPATLTCAKEGVTAKVLKSGEVKVGDESFANLSAAAKAVAGPDKSVNGWSYFLYEGKPVGDLRQN